ncbi:SusD/RagB family nutrient-binding outer membrane lipoprotein [Myroides albus]|uniref:RagB/SusD family nutrient uptake outer membrane protein n=1 Tax=Myroides albus TaxID=2562892 RepID=UPI0021595469|nr:SusD/RagB family nutrient-binding outer membrane lipoprotein [Myroides albus]UVD80678.1 SusD/RagB family nutrient-binding outer membrane lipoprotein [Myroides albus]
MKKIKYIVLVLLSSTMLLQSCSEDKMDDINGNKNDPEYVTSKYLLTDIMTATSFSITGSDLAFYSSIYTELLAGVDNQTYRAQMRSAEPQLASTYNNKWNDLYRQLLSLKDVIEKCSTGGDEEGNHHTLGIAQVLTAYNLGVLTDLWGDVPYSEGLQPGKLFQPKLDKQEDLYKEIFALLDNAVENLSKDTQYKSIGSGDLIYEGDPNSWINAAYALKARYELHYATRTKDFTKVLAAADEAIKGGFKSLAVSRKGIPYPFWLFLQDRGGLASSKSFYDLLKANNANDPRIEAYFTKVNTGTPKEPKWELVLFDSTIDKPREGKGIYSPSGLSAVADLNGKVTGNDNNAIYLMGEHELYFIKAEAEYRLGNEAEALQSLQTAINLAMNKMQTITFAPNSVVVDNSLSGTELLKRIAVEKYISQFEAESIEAYNDIRRWDALGEEHIKLVTPGKFPQRFGYGTSDVTSNTNVKVAFGDGSYVYTEKIWWAGGTR